MAVPVKKAVKKAAPVKAAPKKVVPKKAAPKKAVPKKAVPKKAVPKKTAPVKVAPKKVAPVKAPVAPPQPVVAAPKGPPRKLTARDKRILKIKNTLLMQKHTLLSEAEVAMNALPEQTIFPDLGDQASAETDRNFMLRLRGREQKLIKKIEEAIERIDTWTYGMCDNCGDEIEISRLEARPVTTMCIDCKTEQEEEERLQGD